MAKSEKFWVLGGEFSSFNDWVNHASSYLGPRCGVKRTTATLCVDAKGRPCNIGFDFHRARDENAFPVRYYLRSLPKAVMFAEIDGRKATGGEVAQGAAPEPPHVAHDDGDEPPPSAWA